MKNLNGTKYDTIKRDILEKYKPRQNENVKLPTVRELMKIYNVSYSTISRVLLDLENENLIIRKHGKGIFINEVKEKRVIVLALPLFERIDYFIWGIMQGVMQKSNDLDFTTVVLNSNMRLTRNLRQMILNDVSGFIFFPSDNNDIAMEYTNFLVNNGIKFLFLDRYLNDKYVRIINDHFSAMRNLGKLLNKKKINRVYFVYANRPQLRLTSVINKIEGLKQGIGDKIKFRAVPIYIFYNISMKLNLNNVFVVTNDDFLMFEIINFFKNRNKIIKNISGYGNLFPHHYLTVDQNALSLGQKSIKLLYEIIQNKPLKKLEFLQQCKIIHKN